MKAQRWVWHLVYWIGAYLFLSLFFGYRNSSYNITIWFVTLLLPISMATAYFFNYVIIPRYLVNKKYFFFGLYSFYTLVISVYLELVALIFIFVEITDLDFTAAIFEPLFFLSGMYIPVFLAVLIKLYNNWRITEEERIALTQQKAEAELKLLKSQLHPHFLFNTLNNLYALAIEESDKVPDMILKLAELLNFILYESSSDKIPLDKELVQVQNYIELERLRFDDSCKIDFEIIGNRSDVYILPLSILTLVENSFKHGVQQSPDTKWLKIRVEVASQKINVSVSNSVFNNNEEPKRDGIGLNNLRSRLKLIYKDQFNMKISSEKNEFNVLLQME